MKTYLTYLLFFCCGQQLVCAQERSSLQKAQSTLEAIYSYYTIPQEPLLREHFPFDELYKADYLGTDANQNKPNPYAYLWPYSGSLSAHVALLEGRDNDGAVRRKIEQTVIKGLDMYYDDKRIPAAYASYVNTAPISDRFYDDNIWIGIDFTDLYLLTRKKEYLKKAKDLWAFIASGTDNKLGGGVYWCEQRKESKNTCSNAPSIVYLLKLYAATKDKMYLEDGKKLYAWTRSRLRDSVDGLYLDNINLNGRVDRAKFPYNTGQMMEAAALLYRETGDHFYLEEAQQMATAAYAFFFEADDIRQFRRLKNGNNWFIAIMMRGFLALYEQDKEVKYMRAFEENLRIGWDEMRDSHGLFGNDWTGKQKKDKMWLLDQFAMAEMYARLSAIEKL
ncbi:glycoside hydrolase family 76 protein [Sphingobacterium sp. LRF_L2]|uniref:glycoside hydrolase family 76 protein n=1 Tax=Sphingobacterium sp. LRF_L2 TaxID=3369421 RepID=UPI003F618F0E